MNYQETLDFLYSSLPAYHKIGAAAYKADLTTSLALDEYYSSPHKNYKTVHIAGTNGKGSVAAMLSSILTEAGYKTGLYTSPHIRDFRERIRINGTKIETDYVVAFVEFIIAKSLEHNKNLFEELKPSFFEITAAMAFQYFADCEVDIAIIETGMGGRLDSTNIISPVLSVITNISLDHTQFLGSSKESIAYEKAGIIKDGVPVVIGRSDVSTNQVFTDVAEWHNSPIIFAEIYSLSLVNISHTADRLKVDIKLNSKDFCTNLTVDLGGLYQLENIATTLAAYAELSKILPLLEHNFVDGLMNISKNTGIEGRWQILDRQPMVICDTAHNKDGLDMVFNQLFSIPAQTYRLVIGFVDDKDLDEIFSIFKPQAKYYFTSASIPRSIDAEKLACLAHNAGINGVAIPDVATAYKKALSESEAKDIIFVGGSTFVVADLLNYLC